jgi:hypothetical protein
MLRLVRFEMPSQQPEVPAPLHRRTMSCPEHLVAPVVNQLAQQSLVPLPRSPVTSDSGLDDGDTSPGIPFVAQHQNLGEGSDSGLEDEADGL